MADAVDPRENVRVERRLIKHAMAHPVSGGDLASPGVVAARVAQQDVPERRGAERPEMDETQDEGCCQHDHKIEFAPSRHVLESIVG